MMQLEKAHAFLAPKLRHVMHFVMRQGIAVAGNLLYGLLCVRILPIPDYAKFAVLFGYMGSMTTLLDIGISGTLAPLVGEQIDNLGLIANYVASLRRLGLSLYLFVTPVACAIFVLLVQRQHWGASVVMQMLIVLAVATWFARVSSSYGAVLILRRDRNYYYRIQILGSIGSLSLLLVFLALHRMNIYAAILLNLAQIIFNAAAYFFRSRELLGVKGTPSSQQKKAIVRLALPNVPGAIFYAYQGQVMLILITYFGHGASVANVGALSRLGQIVGFLGQMNPILVEPFFARLQAARLRRVYLAAVGIVTAGAAIFSVTGFLFPQPFLWILGPHYSQLREEVSLMILSTSIVYLAGFLWVVHSSRRFIYWWVTIANISLTLAVEIGFIVNVDLSKVKNVLYLNVTLAVLGLLISVACGIYGFVRGPQKIEREAAQETA